MGHRFRNWARTASCIAEELALPGSEEEVVALVRRAAAARTKVKVAGGGHSWSEAACTGGILVSLDRLQRVLSVEGTEVTVEAGIRLRALNEELAARGLALGVLGSIAEQSIAGAIATGTHGSGPRHGNLASLVTGLRMVTADGAVRDLSPARDPELFAAARVGLGALGIVIRVSLRCEPAFRLEEIATPVPFEEAVAAIPRLVAEEAYVKLWWLPHTDHVQVFRYRRTEVRARFNRVARWIDERIVNRIVFAAVLAAGKLVPALVPWLNRLVRLAYFRPARRVARSDQALTIAMPPRHDECEYALPVERAAEALRGIRRLIEREKLRVDFVVELRFAAADDAWLSPAFGRDSAYLGAYIAGRCDAYFAAFEAEMIALGARPHWGKRFRATAAELRSLFPGYDRFAQLRRRLDPDGLFDNDFLRRIFVPAYGRGPLRRVGSLIAQRP